MMPDWKPEIRRRLLKLKLEPTREAAIVEELAQHLDDCYAEMLASGATEAEAYRATLAELSESELLARELRRVERQVAPEPVVLGTTRRTNMIADLWQDLRFGARMLAKNPGFTLIAVVTLSLGIGANTAVFSVVNAVLLRPLPYAQSDRLVALWGNYQKLNITRLPAKAGEYVDYRDQTQSFAQVAAADSTEYNLTDAGAPERVAGASVTANLFTTLGAQVARGRGFTPGDEQASNAPVAIVSHHFWQQRHGGAADFVGKTLRLNGRPYIVIGILPEGFQYPHPSLPYGAPAEVFTPLVFTPEQITQRGGGYYLNVIAQLKSGVTLAEARAEMTALGQGFVDAKKPGYRGPNNADGDWRITVVPLLEEAVGQSRFALWLLLGAVALVLLIACANVANLLLARATVRQRELAIRAALGASRWQITRQMLCESLLLAGLGAAGGWLLAWWGVAALAKLKLDKLPRVAESTLDARVLGFTLLVTLLTCLLFGGLPAWQAAHTDVQQTLKDGGVAVTRRRPWMRNMLVIGEVALAVLLLVGAGLLLNSLVRLQRLKPGLDVDKLLMVELDLPSERYSGVEPIKAFTENLTERVEALPGVEQASISNRIPLESYVGSDPFMIEGYALDPSQPPNADWRIIAPNYFRTLGIALLRGREFTKHDGNDVAIVNETLARTYWPNTDALGKRLALGMPSPRSPYKTIIGIVADTPHGTLETPPGRDCYFPYAARSSRNICLFVRAAGEPSSLAAAVRQQVWAVDKNQPIREVGTLGQFVSGTLAPRRFNTWLLSGFAALALLLGALGIYSVLAFSVTERRQEMGVRLALGAQPRNMMALVIRQGMTLVAVGVVLGVAGALALTRLLKSLLFGVRATDPLTFIVVALLLALVAMLACWIPARRATKVDPMMALRTE
ncbi:MAG: ADOP family duplicated permease [Blastocatellales bacterium]